MTDHRPIRVLLVEDDHDVRFLSRAVLVQEGLDVVAHASGSAALDWIDATDDLPDLIVLDVQMPGIDGWMVLAHLRSDERHRSIPVLMCTVRVGEQDREYARAAGADAYLAKPFTIDDLITAVRGVIGRPRASVARSRQGDS